MSEEETKTYKIKADYKKSTYQEEHWTNTLKCGKHVTIHVTTFFRWGTFQITLTDKEKPTALSFIVVISSRFEILSMKPL